MSEAQPWRAEWPIDVDLASRLVAAQFPELEPIEARILGEGWDNLAVLINEQLVFRFPRRTLGAEVMKSEIAVLPHLPPLIDTPIPRLTHIGSPSSDFPCRFAGYPLLEGETACSLALTDDERGRLAKPLAHFLRQLHAIDEPQAVAFGAPPDQLRRTEVIKRTSQGVEHLQQAHANGAITASTNTSLQRQLERYSADPPPPADGDSRPRCLVHGDLYVRHLLVSSDGELKGVIDWGDLHYGDPGIDIAFAYGYLPSRAIDVFEAEYGEITPPARKIAMIRSIQHTAVVCNYAHEIHDSRLLDAAVSSLERLEQLVEEHEC